MSAHTPIVDRGPWVAQKWSEKRVVLQSDDFKHDVALIVNGDFADVEQRMAYAEGLAAQINAGTRALGDGDAAAHVNASRVTR